MPLTVRLCSVACKHTCSKLSFPSTGALAAEALVRQRARFAMWTCARCQWGPVEAEVGSPHHLWLLPNKKHDRVAQRDLLDPSLVPLWQQCLSVQQCDRPRKFHPYWLSMVGVQLAPATAQSWSTWSSSRPACPNALVFKIPTKNSAQK